MVGVPIRMVLLWVALSRKPLAREWPGQGVILVGLALLAESLEGGWREPAIVLMILSELCVVASTLLGELHPLNHTDDPRQRAGLTGIMLLASAFFMLLAALGLGLVVQWLPSVRAAVSANVTWLANPSLALDARLWVAAVLVGVVLRGPTMFLFLKAVRRVGTENYIAAMVAIPVLSLAFEAAAAALGPAGADRGGDSVNPVRRGDGPRLARRVLGSIHALDARSERVATEVRGHRLVEMKPAQRENSRWNTSTHTLSTRPVAPSPIPSRG